MRDLPASREKFPVAAGKRAGQWRKTAFLSDTSTLFPPLSGNFEQGSFCVLAGRSQGNFAGPPSFWSSSARLRRLMPPDTPPSWHKPYPSIVAPRWRNIFLITHDPQPI